MEIIFRKAIKDDLVQIVEMLADDELGNTREDISLPLNESYSTAFDLIQNDLNNELIVLENKAYAEKQLLGMLQLTFIPYLTHTGSLRCLIEGVRIHKDYRGQNLGRQTFEWAIKRAKDKGCHMVQLTSNKQRSGAIKFYKDLGFVDSHEGFKLSI